MLYSKLRMMDSGNKCLSTDKKRLTPYLMFCNVFLLTLVRKGIIKTLLEVEDMWQKPTAIEMSCGCEINMYAPAEGDRPLF